MLRRFMTPRSNLFKTWDFRQYDRSFLLFVFVIAGTLAQQAILVTLTKEMAHELPYIGNVRQIGDIAAVGNISMAFASLVWAYLGERVSRRRLLILGGAINALPFLYTVIAPSYPLLAGSYITSYVGRGAFLALSPTIVMDMAPREKRGQALSAMGLTSLLGSAVGTIVPSLLVDACTWRLPMLLVGLFVLSGLAALFFIDFPERGARDKALVSREGPVSEQLTVPDRNALARVFRIRSNVYFALFFALLQFAVGGINYYIFTIFKEEYGLNAASTLGLLLVAQSLIMLGTGFWGPRSDQASRQRAGGRVAVLIVASLLMAVFQLASYAVLPLYRLSPWFILGYLVFSLVSSFGSIRALTPLLNAIVGDTNPVVLRATTISLRNLIGTVCVGLGTLFVGWLQATQGTFTWATIILSAVALGACWLLLPTRKLVPREMASLGLVEEDRSATLELEEA